MVLLLGKDKDMHNLAHFRMTRTNRLQRLFDNSWLWKDINIGFVLNIKIITIVDLFVHIFLLADLLVITFLKFQYQARQ